MWNPVILDVECIVCNKTLHKINQNPHELLKKMGKVSNSSVTRRSRTPNWSVEEKQYLLELIKERKEVVVTKNNNGPNYSEEKDVAWKEILQGLAIKFGSKFIGFSIKKVKTQWQNMKRIAREEISVHEGDLTRFTKLSLDVCYLLDMIKDGVLVVEAVASTSDPLIATNIEIKTERIDDDCQPNASDVAEEPMDMSDCQKRMPNEILQASSNTSSEQASEVCDYEILEPPVAPENVPMVKTNAAAMTDVSVNTEQPFGNPFQKDIQEFFRYSQTEKQLKIDNLREERLVTRALRETAELNKIVAEQKLKHVLWMRRQEPPRMYSGEPGSGAGKGGGGGGSIREAGGAFGKMEAAREDEYFYKKQREQLQNLKGHLDKEIAFHQEQIKRHEDAIRRHKQQAAEFEKK